MASSRTVNVSPSLSPPLVTSSSLATEGYSGLSMARTRPQTSTPTCTFTSKPTMSYVHPYGSTLPEDGVIGRGYGLISDSKRVTFVVTTSGDLQLIGDGRILWSVNGKNASFVKMQTDGNCCGYTPDGVAMWATQTNGNNHPYNLVCQNDGNLVVYEKGGVPVWASQTGGEIHD
ncbi:hypothetical protein GYMLUDRAFT_943117 [Collybiopsis luxurians FD-317 M1]|uniref:Bulb-type lectin domain-containing protein n=1 Tax=Collybiopsis luxurians FD-317 M1 TaxID=944289 RepID=A0A0D0CDZ5_9AGAR|nr:hypothetical protein GYMLUDRAFT_943117 [Collybiopsis luxurians FD-317 M1]